MGQESKRTGGIVIYHSDRAANQQILPLPTVGCDCDLRICGTFVLRSRTFWRSYGLVGFVGVMLFIWIFRACGPSEYITSLWSKFGKLLARVTNCDTRW